MADLRNRYPNVDFFLPTKNGQETLDQNLRPNGVPNTFGMEKRQVGRLYIFIYNKLTINYYFSAWRHCKQQQSLHQCQVTSGTVKLTVISSENVWTSNRCRVPIDIEVWCGSHSWITNNFNLGKSVIQSINHSFTS